MTEKLFAVLIGITILSIMIIGGFWKSKMDEKDWNKGYCNKCWTKWKSFDIDSGGDVGYKCKCGETIWISSFSKIARGD